MDDLPQSQSLPTHLIPKVKLDANAAVDRFRARIVGEGNHQTYGQGYMETYAAVVSFNSVRMFLYIILYMQMYIAQVELKTAFLNGDLEENVSVMAPSCIPGLKLQCY